MHDTGQFVQLFQLGEEKAFDFFFRKYYSTLCLFANTYLNSAAYAEDIVQECFVSLWSRHTKMDNPGAIKSFLYITIRNKCVDVIRRQKTVERALTELQYADETWKDEELMEVTQAETIRHIYSAMDTLPTKMQQVFRMYYIEGKNYAEIASELHTSPNTVRNQRIRALMLIKEKLLLFLTVLLFFL